MSWYKKSQFDFKHQKSLNETIGDIQRYVLDPYHFEVYISKTSKKYSVSIVGQHNYLGSYIYNKFWLFKLNEEERAQNVYKEVSQKLKDIMEDFVENEIPTSCIFPRLNSAFKHLEKDHTIRHNIPFLNYAKDIEVVNDWRSSIYGKRYPSYNETNISDYRYPKIS